MFDDRVCYRGKVVGERQTLIRDDSRFLPTVLLDDCCFSKACSDVYRTGYAILYDAVGPEEAALHAHSFAEERLFHVPREGFCFTRTSVIDWIASKYRLTPEALSAWADQVWD